MTEVSHSGEAEAPSLRPSFLEVQTVQPLWPWEGREWQCRYEHNPSTGLAHPESSARGTPAVGSAMGCGKLCPPLSDLPLSPGSLSLALDTDLLVCLESQAHACSGHVLFPSVSWISCISLPHLLQVFAETSPAQGELL